MGITIKKNRRNLSYDDATTLDELWVIAKQFEIGRASCRERVCL